MVQMGVLPRTPSQLHHMCEWVNMGEYFCLDQQTLLATLILAAEAEPKFGVQMQSA